MENIKKCIFKEIATEAYSKKLLEITSQYMRKSFLQLKLNMMINFLKKLPIKLIQLDSRVMTSIIVKKKFQI